MYLPQFHPIPENDEWWGKGFTEWTNVVKAKPLFKGHYQPQLPADLGFYDLRLSEAREAQAELAKEYGIYGFCYYYYWFNGKRLLEKPIEGVLASGKPDFPFMICWANENWSRRWDGSENEILIAQNYSREDAVLLAKDLIKYFRDDRYIKIEGKPFFSIYNPFSIPNLDEYITTIRKTVYEIEKVDLFFCAFDTGNKDILTHYQLFDSIIEFQPHSRYLWKYMDDKIKNETNHIIKNTYNHLLVRFGLKEKIKESYYKAIYRLNYEHYVDYVIKNYIIPTSYDLFPGINPMWDNTARRGRDAFLFYNNSPQKYGEWLSFILEHYPLKDHENNFLFINAWNEWAEGNHLEPCEKFGKQYLSETRNQLLLHGSDEGRRL